MFCNVTYYIFSGLYLVFCSNISLSTMAFNLGCNIHILWFCIIIIKLKKFCLTYLQNKYKMVLISRLAFMNAGSNRYVLSY